MSKVVVEVVADTKPFLRSIAKMRKIAAQLNNNNYKSSTKLLKSILEQHKLNAKITKEAQKQTKEYAKAGKVLSENVRSMGKLAAVGFVASRVLSGIKAGYATGAGIINAAATYGGSPEEVSRARALIARGGGRAEEGEEMYKSFMQNRMLFEKYQQGGFKEAATRFGIDPRVFMQENLTGLVESLRGLKQARGYDNLAMQAILQDLGLGNNAAMMRLINMSNEDYAFNLAKVNENMEETVSDYERQLKMQQEWNDSMDRLKKNLIDLSNAFLPVIEWFNKLPSGLKIVAGAATVSGWGLTALGASLKGFALLGKVFGIGGAGAAAAGGAGAVGAIGTMSASTIAVLGSGIIAAIHDGYKMLSGKADEALGFRFGEWLTEQFVGDATNRNLENFNRVKNAAQTNNWNITIETRDSSSRGVAGAMYDLWHAQNPESNVNMRGF